jgi:DNA-binding NarL/FixJ family response regulator
LSVRALADLALAPATSSVAQLSKQQLLDHFLQGLTNKEIATHLNLRMATAKHYATQLFKKMRVRNRLEAIVATQQMSCG